MYLKSFINSYVLNGFTFDDAKSEIDFILEIIFNYKYKDFLLGKKLKNSQINEVQKIIDERISTKRPIQQILGKSFFYNRFFYVNKYTLIPRPETELLVNEILKNSENRHNVLDIGTGTGCIGITLLLENSSFSVDLVDIQQEALEIAIKNADLYGIKNKINFIKSDLFENVKKKYDIIVSNPPYIPLKDKETLQIEVKDYESSTALFTKDDEGLEIYEKIIFQACNYLNNNGLLAFELGINQSEKVKKLLKKNGFSNINVTKDYNFIDRIITANYFVV